MRDGLKRYFTEYTFIKDFVMLGFILFMMWASYTNGIQHGLEDSCQDIGGQLVFIQDSDNPKCWMDQESIQNMINNQKSMALEYNPLGEIELK